MNFFFWGELNLEFLIYLIRTILHKIIGYKINERMAYQGLMDIW